MPKARNVDEYVAAAPPDARRMLKQLRSAITSVAPEAEERISYSMPYYGHHGRLAYFAAFKNHVSLFIMRLVMKRYAQEVKRYRTSTSTLRFPIGSAIPVALVKKLVKAQVKENEVRRGGTQ